MQKCIPSTDNRDTSTRQRRASRNRERTPQINNKNPFPKTFPLQIFTKRRGRTIHANRATKQHSQEQPRRTFSASHEHENLSHASKLQSTQCLLSLTLPPTPPPFRRTGSGTSHQVAAVPQSRLSPHSAVRSSTRARRLAGQGRISISPPPTALLTQHTYAAPPPPLSRRRVEAPEAHGLLAIAYCV